MSLHDRRGGDYEAERAVAGERHDRSPIVRSGARIQLYADTGGIDRAWVNGVEIVRGGEHSSMRSGTALGACRDPHPVSRQAMRRRA